MTKKTPGELRLERQKAKEIAQNLDNATLEEIALVQKVLPNMSAVGYMFCKVGMKMHGFEGMPGIDMKTYKGRQENGFKVKKGEKSKVYGLSRVSIKKDGDDEFLYPKQYHLFHRSQVE